MLERLEHFPSLGLTGRGWFATARGGRATLKWVVCSATIPAERARPGASGPWIIDRLGCQMRARSRDIELTVDGPGSMFGERALGHTMSRT
jgi:hypothetical protein